MCRARVRVRARVKVRCRVRPHEDHQVLDSHTHVVVRAAVPGEGEG